MATDRFSQQQRAKLEELSLTRRIYEKEREELAAKIVELDLKVIEVQAKYGAIYNKNAPILKLPTEITCLIFAFSVALTESDLETEEEEEDADEEKSNDSDKYLMEVIVSHVCHRWRTIALTFAPLWSSFCYDGPKSKRAPIDRLSAYLQRSGSQLLELWLEFRDAPKDPLHLVMLETVITHVDRWKRVTILADERAPIPHLTPVLCPLRAPNLEYLAICPDMPFPQDPTANLDIKTPMIFAGGAPKLKSVWMDGSSPYNCLPPLFNLTTLRIEELESMPDTRFSWYTFLDILAIPTLENLSLVGMIFEQPITDEINIITTNNLKHLRYSGNDFLNRVLVSLRAPCLETLVVHNTDIGDDEMMIPLDSDLEQYSFPSLTALTLIETTAASPDGALAFARLTTSIKNLLLSYENSEDCILRDLPELVDPQEKLWPNLQVITCNFDTNYEDPSYPVFFTDIAKWRPAMSLTFRVLDEHVQQWRTSVPYQLEALESYCTVEEMNPHQPIVEILWPPGEDVAGYIVGDIDDDPFALDTYH